MDKLAVTTFPHNWGFLMPCESGFIWQQQTDGIMCHQIFIEGVFIPLERPKGNFGNDLLKELQEANYDGKSTKELWKRIKEAMHFNFEEVDAPEGMPISQEGLLWIKLTKFESGWGHGDWVKAFIGKTMALIYPNCD